MSADTVARVYAFVLRYMMDHGEAPTLREIASGVGRSYETVRTHMNTLVASGALIRSGSRERGWTVSLNLRRRAPGDWGPPPKLVEPVTLSDQTRQGIKDVLAIYAQCIARDGPPAKISCGAA